MAPDDTELMRRIQAGDEEAFEAFVGRYQRRLYRLAHASLGSREEALDATQEAFVKIYRARHRWRPEAKPSTWAYRILINHCIDRSRRRKLRARFSADRGGSALEELPAPGDSPLAHSLRREQRERVVAAVSRLPERQRVMLLLRHGEGLSLEEIAATMGCSTGTVKSTLHRAIGKLRAMMVPARVKGSTPGESLEKGPQEGGT